MELPFVSVIVPVYNETRHIDKCLASVVGQDYPPGRMEVLLVDGGSTDDTRDRVEAFIREHPSFAMLDNPRRVQASAVNIGIQNARGEVIVRFDAHSKYPNDYVRRCVATMAESGAEVVGGMVLTVPAGPGLVPAAIAACGRSRFGIGGARFRVGGQAGPVDTVPFGTYRREVFDRVGLFDEDLFRAEDNEFHGRVRAAGMTVYFDPKITAVYYARPSVYGFLKQLFGNGKYHLLTMLVCRSAVSMRHFIPAVFVLTLLAGMLLGLLLGNWWLLLAVGGTYMLADIAASAAVARQDVRFLLVLPWLFFLMHLTYGLATLVGGFTYALPTLFSRGRGRQAGASAGGKAPGR
jgi:glycosyltransferase involved in cell wall biosynthesis